MDHHRKCASVDAISSATPIVSRATPFYTLA